MADYYARRIAEVKEESEARAQMLADKAFHGEISYTEAWYSLPGPSADLNLYYPFLCRGDVLRLKAGMVENEELRRANETRVKAEGDAWHALWEKHERAVCEEREAFLQLMEQPVDEDELVDLEARRRLANPKFESEVRRRMKQIQAEAADLEIASILQG